MAEFTPEYEALMRQLALAREFQEGDWMLEIVTVSGDQTKRWALDQHGARFWQRAHPKFERRGLEHTYWLPLEGDWLRMLEDAGYADVLFECLEAGGWRASVVEPHSFAAEGWEVSEEAGKDLERQGSTRLEALARLWMAVTGREA